MPGPEDDPSRVLPPYGLYRAGLDLADPPLNLGRPRGLDVGGRVGGLLEALNKRGGQVRTSILGEGQCLRKQVPGCGRHVQ